LSKTQRQGKRKEKSEAQEDQTSIEEIRVIDVGEERRKTRGSPLFLFIARSVGFQP
jgi:hypothetical protein